MLSIESHDTLLERVVALRFISTSIEDNPDLRERFFGKRARPSALASEHHHIHDLGEHEGQPFLSMEFLTGEDLQHRLARQEPMTSPQARGGQRDLRGPVLTRTAAGSCTATSSRPHLHHRRRCGEAARLRSGPDGDFGAHAQQHDDGHPELHVARTGTTAERTDHRGTSSRSASCSTKCSVGERRFRETRSPPRSTRSCRTYPNRSTTSIPPSLRN